MQPIESQQAEERLWVLRAHRGDVEAFQHLVEYYDRRILYYVLRFVDNPEPAMDIVQEVWLEVYLRLPQLKELAAFRVWLYRIVRGKAVDFLRYQRRSAELLSVMQTEPPPEPDMVNFNYENAELVHRVLRELSLAHRDVLTLRFLENMSLEEIAAVVGCELGTVKSRLHYAKAAFRDVMQSMLS